MIMEISKHRVEVVDEKELSRLILEICPVAWREITEAILTRYIVLKVNQEPTRS